MTDWDKLKTEIAKDNRKQAEKEKTEGEQKEKHEASRRMLVEKLSEAREMLFRELRLGMTALGGSVKKPGFVDELDGDRSVIKCGPASVEIGFSSDNDPYLRLKFRGPNEHYGTLDGPHGLKLAGDEVLVVTKNYNRIWSLEKTAEEIIRTLLMKIGYHISAGSP
jgi:hypothetical protein